MQVICQVHACLSRQYVDDSQPPQDYTNIHGTRSHYIAKFYEAYQGIELTKDHCQERERERDYTYPRCSTLNENPALSRCLMMSFASLQTYLRLKTIITIIRCDSL